MRTTERNDPETASQSVSQPPASMAHAKRIDTHQSPRRGPSWRMEVVWRWDCLSRRRRRSNKSIWHFASPPHLLFDNHHRQHVPVRVRHSLLRCVVLSRAGTVSPLTSAAIILLINAIAILSEDRFLARSTSTPALSTSKQASIGGSKESREPH